MDEIASSLVGKRVYDCFSGENFSVMISPIFPILILLLLFMTWSGKLLVYCTFDSIRNFSKILLHSESQIQKSVRKMIKFGFENIR